MPQEISDELKVIKNILEQEEPWIYLCEIELPAPILFKRLTNHVANVLFDGHNWQAWPFAPSGMKLTSSGELMTASVVIGNAGGYFTQYLNDNNGLIGYEGNLYKVSKAKLDDPLLSVIPNKFKILTSGEIAGYVTFNLSLGIDLYGIEGPIVDYDLVNSPSLPYGPARISLGCI